MLEVKAIDHYEKFLSIWKDADPGIAEVEREGGWIEKILISSVILFIYIDREMQEVPFAKNCELLPMNLKQKGGIL